jgi:DNA-binding transcriptional LysR family regulator
MGLVDLNTLVIFAKVVEANGFSEAARRLKLPLSTVSRRVADLEEQLGVQLLVRSTRQIGLTSVGSELLEHAQRSAEIGEAVASVVSYQTSTVSGTLRLSAPPSISDSLLAPIVGAFQEQHPGVRVQVLVTERMVDHIAEGVDLVFRIGVQKDSSLVTQKLLSYRHRLVASPKYLRQVKEPRAPSDLLGHRLIAFSHLRPERTWNFVNAEGTDKVALQFQPYLSMNDFAGLAAALLAGVGIGDLPPIVRPELIREGRLVEVMSSWKFRPYSLSLLQVTNRRCPKHVTLFKQLAIEMAPKLFPDLPA